MRYLSTILVLFLATGCASTSKRIDYVALTQSNLTANQSTKDDVLKLLGKPQNKTVMNYQMPALPYADTSKIMPYEMWTYSWYSLHMHNKNNKTGMAGFFSPVVADQDIQTLVINFDREGKMIGYTTNETSI